MEKKDMIWTACIALVKNLDYETLKYSDYMYGKEAFTDQVWEYVEEAKDLGIKQFKQTYCDYNLYTL